MIKELKRIKADIFITEFFPFGRWECKYEVMPIIEWLRQRKVKIYCCLSYPYFIQSQDDISELLEITKFYDKIFIHTACNLDLNYVANNIYLEKRISKSSFISVFEYLKPKIFFTGYILPIDNLTNLNHVVNEQLILVHRGSGTIFPKLITSSILASEFLDKSFKLLVIAGPATTASEMNFFKGLIKQRKLDNVCLRKYIPNLFDYLKMCGISINTVGGTAHELLYLRKKAILVPFCGYPNRRRTDQICRAKMLEDYIDASILDYDSLTPERLAREIMKKINTSSYQKYKDVDEKWFKGSKTTADMIMQSL
jgi:predicted glycosyltransferase